MLIYLFIPEIIPYQRNLIKTSYISNTWRCCSFPSTFTKCKQTKGKNKTQLLQFFNIFIITVASILINIYYYQVHIAQIMKLDVKKHLLWIKLNRYSTYLLHLVAFGNSSEPHYPPLPPWRIQKSYWLRGLFTYFIHIRSRTYNAGLVLVWGTDIDLELGIEITIWSVCQPTIKPRFPDNILLMVASWLYNYVHNTYQAGCYVLR